MFVILGRLLDMLYTTTISLQVIDYMQVFPLVLLPYLCNLEFLFLTWCNIVSQLTKSKYENLPDSIILCTFDNTEILVDFRENNRW